MHSLPRVPPPLPPLLLPTEIAGFENPPDVQNTVMCWGKAVGYSNHELEGVSEGLKTQALAEAFQPPDPLQLHHLHQ